MSDLTDRKKDLDALLAKFTAENPTLAVLTSTDPAEIGEYLVTNAPVGKAQKWLTALNAIIAPPGRWPSPGVLLLSTAGILFAGALLYGIFVRPTFLTEMAEPGIARGLITFLFAFATVSVIIISVIAVFWVKIEEVKDRGILAKEILTILIGIMGTILGFYFGAELASTTPPPTTIETPSG